MLEKTDNLRPLGGNFAFLNRSNLKCARGRPRFRTLGRLSLDERP
jgi:hypothetical protein